MRVIPTALRGDLVIAREHGRMRGGDRLDDVVRLRNRVVNLVRTRRAKSHVVGCDDRNPAATSWPFRAREGYGMRTALVVGKPSSHRTLRRFAAVSIERLRILVTGRGDSPSSAADGWHWSSSVAYKTQETKKIKPGAARSTSP